MPEPGATRWPVPTRYPPFARPSVRPFASDGHPPIELFLDEHPPIELFLDELPLINDYVAEDPEQDEAGWAIADWQKYDWGGLAALGPSS